MKNLNTLSRGDIVIAENTYASGSIQHGARPYLIISNDNCNKFSSVVTAVPLTTKKIRNNLMTHYNIKINGVDNCVLCEQVTSINKYAIYDYICTLDEKSLSAIENKIKIQLGMKGE